MKFISRGRSIIDRLVSFQIFAVLLISATVQAQNLSLTSTQSPIGERGLVYKGAPVFLVGSGSFWLLNDPFYYNADGTTNVARLADHLDKYRPANTSGKALGVIRVSAFGTPVRYSGVDPSKKKYPCARSGVSGARDGGNKFDCSQLDQQFFDHVLTVAREADRRGIILGIILWDEIPLESAGTSRWTHNPFCPENSVIGYGLPSCTNSAVPEFYDLGSNLLRNHQTQIVHKFVATLRNEPNIFFFVGNEYTGGTKWRDTQIAEIDAANTLFNTDILHVTMDYGPGDSPLSDGVSSDTNKTGLGSDAFRIDGRPAINQRDYRLASGADVRRTNWSRFMDGAASAGTRDDYSGNTPPSSSFSTAALEDEQLRRFVNSIKSNLDEMAISDGIFSAGWSARGNNQTEYVAYNSSSSGSISIDLSGQSGDWQLFEWDTSSDGPPIAGATRTGGKSVIWNLSFQEPAVRIVRVDGAAVRPEPPKNLRTN